MTTSATSPDTVPGGQGDGLEIHWALPAGARIPSLSRVAAPRPGKHPGDLKLRTWAVAVLGAPMQLQKEYPVPLAAHTANAPGEALRTVQYRGRGCSQHVFLSCWGGSPGLCP